MIQCPNCKTYVKRIKCRSCKQVYEIDSIDMLVEKSFSFSGRPSYLRWPVLIVGGIFLSLFGIIFLFMPFPYGVFIYLFANIPLLIVILKKYSSFYQILDDKIVVKTGIFSINKSVINRKNIKSIKVKTSIFSFGLSDILFNVSGDIDDVILLGISNELAKEIQERFSN